MARATEGLIQGWFRVEELEPGVFAIEEPLHEERVKSYLILGEERALLLDTGMGVGDVRSLVEGFSALPVVVVNSHAHWDHVGGNRRFEGEAEILIHAAEAPALARGVPNEKLRRAFAPETLRGPLPPGFEPEGLVFPPSRATRELVGGETLDLGGRRLEVIHAPGHSPGGIVLLDRVTAALFSTDVAYPGDLYCFSTDADFGRYRESMTRLAEFAPALRVAYPAHDEAPMDPALLPRMRDTMDAIAGGRAPDAVDGGVGRWGGDGFAVLVAIEQVGQ